MTTKTVNLPEFTPPPDLPPVGMFLMLQPKKCGKTSLAALLCSCLSRANYDLFVLRNDEHNRFDPYCSSNRIELSTTSDVIAGRISLDLDRHEILIDTIAELSDPRRMIIYDSSAAAGDRLPTILYRDLYAAQFSEMGRSIVCLVPLRPNDDIAAGALQAITAAQASLDGAIIVPVVIAADVDIEQLPPDHAFFKCIERARHGVIRLEHFNQSIMFHIDRLEVPLDEFRDPTSLATRRRARTLLDCTTGQAGLVVAAVADLIASVELELAKLDLNYYEQAAE